MEEYLEFMKTLRSQINDVEDQGSKISAQEQMHFTTIQTLQDDIVSVKSQGKQLREDTEKMVKAKGQICSEIIGKQRKIASLESDSFTLTQTLELIQQEKLSLSSKLMEKSTYYSKVAKDLSTKLQQQQDWVKSLKISRQIEEHGLVNNELDGQMTESEGKCGIENHPIMDYVNNEADNDLIVKLDLAKAKLDGIVQMKAKLVTDNGKIKESIEEAKCRANNFKPEVLEMSTDALEEEYKVLLSEKDGETEYLCSLQNQVERMKGISNVIKCACGEEYTVKLHA
ncbi:hypothetical protein QUC31_001279 [Theobroma cacao]|uniref:Uncharacterized protein n=1 Tax=Theobroma cacao TaxID=3641 RepID=A0A061FJW2_THECC|nr:Uncharacterized protein TCM_036062 [Theobroma cacao]WRX31090.1 hypothetical protein QQP08_023577 [Theobroma cacao]